MGRRANYEGTLYRRPGRSRWEGQVMLGGRRYSVSGRTRTEVVARLRELVIRFQAGCLAPPSALTFGEWARDWLSQGEGRWRQSTHRRVTQALRPLIERLGGVRLSRLQPMHLLRALEELRLAGAGPRALQMAYDAAHACLEEGRRLGIVSSNVAARVARPTYRREEQAGWGIEDMRRFLRVALEDGSPTALMLAFGLLTGLRPSEALGLRWEDVDWEAGTVTVRRALVWAGAAAYSLQPPKSARGERTIALPRLGIGILERLRGRLPWVFWTGRPPKSYDLAAAMARLCARAGVPRRPAHYLRHAHASLLVGLGVDVKTAQRRLGHSSANMTLDTYAHYLPGAEGAVARMLDQALGQNLDSHGGSGSGSDGTVPRARS